VTCHFGTPSNNLKHPDVTSLTRDSIFRWNTPHFPLFFSLFPLEKRWFHYSRPDSDVGSSPAARKRASSLTAPVWPIDCCCAPEASTSGHDLPGCLSCHRITSPGPQHARSFWHVSNGEWTLCGEALATRGLPRSRGWGAAKKRVPRSLPRGSSSLPRPCRVLIHPTPGLGSSHASPTRRRPSGPLPPLRALGPQTPAGVITVLGCGGEAPKQGMGQQRGGSATLALPLARRRGQGEEEVMLARTRGLPTSPAPRGSAAGRGAGGWSHAQQPSAWTLQLLLLPVTSSSPVAPGHILPCLPINHPGPPLQPRPTASAAAQAPQPHSSSLPQSSMAEVTLLLAPLLVLLALQCAGPASAAAAASDPSSASAAAAQAQPQHGRYLKDLFLGTGRQRTERILQQTAAADLVINYVPQNQRIPESSECNSPLENGHPLCQPPVLHPAAGWGGLERGTSQCVTVLSI